MSAETSAPYRFGSRSVLEKLDHHIACYRKFTGRVVDALADFPQIILSNDYVSHICSFGAFRESDRTIIRGMSIAANNFTLNDS
jgi:hypothetical protein